MAKGKFEALLALASVFGGNSQLEFCTESVYSAGQFCPEYGPTSGSGTCCKVPITSTKCCQITPRSMPFDANIPAKIVSGHRLRMLHRYMD